MLQYKIFFLIQHRGHKPIHIFLHICLFRCFISVCLVASYLSVSLINLILSFLNTVQTRAIFGYSRLVHNLRRNIGSTKFDHKRKSIVLYAWDSNPGPQDESIKWGPLYTLIQLDYSFNTFHNTLQIIYFALPV